MDGIHLLGEWYGCPADLPEMTRAEAARLHDPARWAGHRRDDPGESRR